MKEVKEFITLYDFNSDMVRLRATADNIETVKSSIFQFRHGAIKRILANL